MTALALCLQNSAYAQDNAVISQMVEADACDDRQQDFDKQTMEYRAVDKASLIAVKSAGIIQKYGENLTPSVVDIIAYRLIDGRYGHQSLHRLFKRKILAQRLLFCNR